MIIYIGADHNGFELKTELKDFLTRSGYQVIDEGDQKLNPDDDFPVFAAKVAQSVLKSDDSDPRGILICGSGQGVCMAANRFRGIRASLVWDRNSAQEARNDDNANVLCLPAKLLRGKQADPIVETWLRTPYANAARFNRRLKEIDEY